jgi:hypothetical protein
VQFQFQAILELQGMQYRVQHGCLHLKPDIYSFDTFYLPTK